MLAEVLPPSVRHKTHDGPDEWPVKSTRYGALVRVGVGDGDECDYTFGRERRKVMGLCTVHHVAMTGCRDTAAMEMS